MIYKILFAASLIGAPAVATIPNGTEEVTSIETISNEEIENDTSSIYEISSEETESESEEVLTDDNVFGEWLKNTFSAQTISLIISAAANILLVIKLIQNAKDAILHNSFSLKNVDEHNKTSVSNSVDQNIDTKIKPIFDATNKNIEKMIGALELTCKMIAAAQDQSSTGKEYFAKLTQSMGEVFNSSKEFAKETADKLNEQIELAKKITKDTEDRLQKIVDEAEENESTPVE